MFNEDKTSNTNDEQTLDDNVSSDEDNSTSEGDGEASSEGEESDTVTLTKAELDAKLAERAKEQDKRWKDRLKNAGKDDESEDGDEEGSQARDQKEVGDERYDRLELKTEGIKDKKEQDAIIEYARFKGIDVIDAANSPAMRAELKEMRNKAATPSSSTRTGTGSRDDVAYWAKQLEKNGKSAPTAELRAKVRTYLAGK